MPNFQLMPLDEARKKAALGGKRGELLAEYLGYIDGLQEGQAASLKAAEGETVGAVRRRLGAAARLGGKELVIKRVDDEVYFWLKEPDRRGRGRRRGRPKASSGDGS